MASIPAEAWQGGAAVVAVWITVQSSWSFARWIIARRNGRNGGNSENKDRELCHKHAERLAVLESSHRTLVKGQEIVVEKVECIDRKLSRVLTLMEVGHDRPD